MGTHFTEYDFSSIESHWQNYWETNKTFKAIDFEEKPKYYILDMFPYPSGTGLHIGHPEGYTASDILARYKKACGYNVLHPMGWDAFGLPAEQHAIATGTPPEKNTLENIATFRRQIKQLGFAIDWEREISTTDPNYYKWTQWIFLQLFKHGLAYVEEKPVWWCPALNTVLANEEVIEGRSERGNHPVERRNLRQWVLRITAYAEQLLKGLEELDWPVSTKRLQTNWIGRSEGVNIVFPIEAHPDQTLTVFTTRADTLFGATYMVIAPEHPLLTKITKPEKRDAVNAYLEKVMRKSDLERTDLAKEKSGIFTGSFAVNPISGVRIPIWVADYVLISYGTGAIMAVPAHDERDYDFAKTFALPITPVIEGNNEPLPFCGKGVLINSGAFSGLSSEEGKEKITEELIKKGRGKNTINYKLRDWLFSRQRYWGEPIPIVWINESSFQILRQCHNSPLHQFLPEKPVFYEKEGKRLFAVPLPEEALPLKLPPLDRYLPSEKAESPLAKAKKWCDIYLHLTTGKTLPGYCNPPLSPMWVEANRETNTMPQWAGSCWYFLRYTDPHNSKELISSKLEAYWKKPDLYIGGAEHAVLHLLYARFWHLFLHDIGVVSEREPFKRLFHQGIILGEDGQKMSKSRGNTVNPETIVATYGADALRLFEMFLGPLEDTKPWNTKGIEGVSRFLRKIWRGFLDEGQKASKITHADMENAKTESLLHETIKKVTEDIEKLAFNTAISQMMIFINHLTKIETFTHKTACTFLQLLAPFAPHFAEELWKRLGKKPSIVHAPWPTYDENKLIKEENTLVFQINGKVRGEASVAITISKEEAIALAKKHPRILAHLQDKTIVREIYLPGKILNLVVR